MEFIHNHRILSAFALIIIMIMVSVLTFQLINHYERRKIIQELDSLNLSEYNKLMVVAHPDDEMLWGGAALIEDNYLVVCVTCGSNRIRVKEFKNVMEATDDKYIMLNYPDKILYKRSNWKYEYKYIKEDVKRIINYKNWDEIVTHNKYGEYGHQHHKMTHDIVTSISNRNKKDKTKVFNRYCSLNKMSSGKCSIEGSISNENTNKKAEILYKYYKSQTNTINLFKHMLPFEALNKE